MGPFLGEGGVAPIFDDVKKLPTRRAACILSGVKLLPLALTFLVLASGATPIFAATDAASTLGEKKRGNKAPGAVEGDWRAGAQARIEKHRKAPLRVVVTQNGRPVPGVQVQIDQTRSEFLFGCNIFKLNQCGSRERDAAYAKYFADIFNFATAGFYWSSYEPRKGDTKSGRNRNEQIAKWCAERGIRLKGHTLFWNYYDPAWAKGVDDAELYSRQLQHCKNSVEQFSGKISVWDVVNETTEWDTEDRHNRSPRATRFLREKGVANVIKDCFAAARSADGKALMLVNDYEKTEAFAKRLEELVGPDGKPIYDAIGMQSHMHDKVWSNEQIWEICERLARFKKPIHFTELTILSSLGKFVWLGRNDAKKTTPEGEAWQSEQLERVYTMLFSHPSVEAITWWDFTDLDAWMGCCGGLLRSDMTPKPAYETLRKLITNTWATHKTLRTNAMGVAELRAFRGDYTVRATLPDGKVIERKLSLGKTGAEVRL